MSRICGATRCCFYPTLLYKNGALINRLKWISLCTKAKAWVIRTRVTESLGCTIALIQQTKASHCLKEIWEIAKMKSNWKVWMAFFIESKPCERETVFRCRLFRLVFTALSLGFHVSCRITAEGVFFSHSRKEKGPFFVYLHHCQVANKPSFKERGPLSNGCCFHGDRGMKCSLLIQYEWPFCLSSLSSDCPEKHKATNTSMDFQSHNWACRVFLSLFRL